jgi:hypothetical protein
LPAPERLGRFGKPALVTPAVSNSSCIRRTAETSADKPATSADKFHPDMTNPEVRPKWLYPS